MQVHTLLGPTVSRSVFCILLIIKVLHKVPTLDYRVGTLSFRLSINQLQNTAPFLFLCFFILSLQSLRKDGRVAEGAGLENRYTLHGVSGVRIPLLPQTREKHRNFRCDAFIFEPPQPLSPIDGDDRRWRRRSIFRGVDATACIGVNLRAFPEGCDGRWVKAPP